MNNFLFQFKSLALAAKVSKRIPGNETLALIRGANKKVHQPTKKDTLKPLKDINKEMKDGSESGRLTYNTSNHYSKSNYNANS